MAMSSGASASADFGRLILRLALGVLFLMHGIAKVVNGPGGIVAMVEQAGMPGPVAYLVYVGEVLAPLLVIIGLWTRPAALVIAINMVFAIGLAHLDDLGALTKTGGWALELQGMYLFSALALALMGAGRYSIGGRRGRFN
jgi:putative oxidoreductase